MENSTDPKHVVAAVPDGRMLQLWTTMHIKHFVGELDFFSIQGLNFFNIGSSGVFTCQGEVDHTPEESETSYWLGHNNSRHFGQGSSTNSFLC